MRPRSLWLSVVVLVVTFASGCVRSAPSSVVRAEQRFTREVSLPPPDTHGSMTLDQALARRRSERSFSDRPLPLSMIGQLLWAAQGVTDPGGKRAAPSAGALYPLELYVVTAHRLMHYRPAGHRLELRTTPDLRPGLERAALGQPAVGSAPAVVVVAAVPARTRAKYGARADAFVEREAGHATQNLLLEATSRGLAAVTMGGIDPTRAARLLALPPDQEVLGLVPVGYPPD